MGCGDKRDSAAASSSGSLRCEDFGVAVRDVDAHSCVQAEKRTPARRSWDRLRRRAFFRGLRCARGPPGFGLYENYNVEQCDTGRRDGIGGIDGIGYRGYTTFSDDKHGQQDAHDGEFHRSGFDGYRTRALQRRPDLDHANHHGDDSLDVDVDQRLGEEVIEENIGMDTFDEYNQYEVYLTDRVRDLAEYYSVEEGDPERRSDATGFDDDTFSVQLGDDDDDDDGEWMGTEEHRRTPQAEGPLDDLQYGGSFFSVADALCLSVVNRACQGRIASLWDPPQGTWMEVLGELEDRFSCFNQLLLEFAEDGQLDRLESWASAKLSAL
eukprot:CAMPEP_0203916136 /NCGR_PEP_ID=MMETSP0359-20131031/56829_1 /ASSEMBLY_ACC=CAM_ASM_000338 /TAXON_ID=268821 /ORGANISM="Scrippsiella Hangoei, Strain SHTV-5" /LENGTH=323 /DNA_ID=CAMNT_0050842767 /DNA_START=56 /DNA_END=1027 /DNA_ORIENTATION=+